MSEPTGRPDPRATALISALAEVSVAAQAFRRIDLGDEGRRITNIRHDDLADVIAEAAARIGTAYPPIQNEKVAR